MQLLRIDTVQGSLPLSPGEHGLHSPPVSMRGTPAQERTFYSTRLALAVRSTCGVQHLHHSRQARMRTALVDGVCLSARKCSGSRMQLSTSAARIQFLSWPVHALLRSQSPMFPTPLSGNGNPSYPCRGMIKRVVNRDVVLCQLNNCASYGFLRLFPRQRYPGCGAALQNGFVFKWSC